MIDLSLISSTVEAFKATSPAAESVVSLAGTGPNGACQIPAIDAIGSDYLRQLKALNIISASSFSFFIYLASEYGQLNTSAFLNYEQHTRQTHGFPVIRLLNNIIKGNPRRQLYNNELIAVAVDHLYQDDFSNSTLASIDFPVNFYVFCTKQKRIVVLNASTFPSITIKDISRACVSIPWIHGAFEYRDHVFIDPIFSDQFPQLRERLFKQSSNHLYLNYKKQGRRGSIYFLKNEVGKYPNVTLTKDFIKFYLGIHNRRVINTHGFIFEQGVLNGCG